MELTPNDIRNFEFSTQLRGYDKDAVDEFVEKCAQAMEAVKQESVKLAMELESVKGQLDGLKQFEDAIKSAAIDARKNADQTVRQAKKEAEQMLEKAREQAEQTIKHNQHKLEAINGQLKRLTETRASYIEQLQTMMQSHLMMVDAIEKNEALAISPDEDIAVEASAEVDGRIKETIAKVESSEVDEEVSEKNELEDSGEVEAEPQYEPHSISDSGKIEEVKAEASDNDSDESDPESAGEIDPELAAALQKYKHDVDEDQAAENKKAAPKPGQMVETTARAEDIPEGFITNSRDAANDRAIEENEVNLDASQPVRGNGMDLASELDNVVAKFEEEMDKAAKS